MSPDLYNNLEDAEVVLRSLKFNSDYYVAIYPVERSAIDSALREISNVINRSKVRENV